MSNIILDSDNKDWCVIIGIQQGWKRLFMLNSQSYRSDNMGEQAGCDMIKTAIGFERFAEFADTTQ